nr:FAD-dependent oxidoreductase [bacterium]
MQYLWTQGVDMPRFPSLEGDCQTDVLVIGGGMAGILCAHMLQEAGADYLLVEGERIGGGVTKGTTAVLTAQHDTLYADLIQKFGRQTAKGYLDANLWAVEHFRHMARFFACDLEDKPSVMYTQHNPKRLEEEARAVQSLGFEAAFESKTPLPFEVAGAVIYPAMAQFHPLKLMAGVSRRLHIREKTFVRRLEGTRAYTDKGIIRANKVIVATHFPFVNRHGGYYMKLFQMRSFVLALEGAPDIGCTAVDSGENGFYLRNYGGLLLVGGGDQRTGKIKQGYGFEAVRAFVRDCFPGALEKMAWATQDCISLDGVPYIGPYSPAMPGVYVASGFNEWGMTSSMVAARMLTDMAMGKPSPFAGVFSPQRSMLRTQLFVNLGATVANFAIPTPRRCPHLGCALRWNKAEHSWDCPCHGSRFDENGRLVDNPAMRDSHV